jgi:hypothetical protein
MPVHSVRQGAAFFRLLSVAAAPVPAPAAPPVRRIMAFCGRSADTLAAAPVGTVPARNIRMQNDTAANTVFAHQCKPGHEACENRRCHH